MKLKEKWEGEPSEKNHETMNQKFLWITILLLTKIIKMNKQRLFCFEKKSLKFRLMISEFTGEQDKNQSLQKISWYYCSFEIQIWRFIKNFGPIVDFFALHRHHHRFLPLFFVKLWLINSEFVVGEQNKEVWKKFREIQMWHFIKNFGPIVEFLA